MEIKTQKDLLRAAILLERLAQKVYTGIADLFRYEKGISLIFEELAADEEQHIKLLSKLLAGLPTASGKLPCSFQHCEKLQSILEHLEHIDINAIENLNDAYELAHDLEFSEINSIFLQIILLCADDDEEHTFIKQEIIEHQKKIFTLKTQFGDKQKRKTFVAQPV